MVMWAFSDLHLKNINKTTWHFVYFRFTALSRSFVETTIKANKFDPDNRDWGALAGKYINNHTRGRSRKGRIWSGILLEGGSFGGVSVVCRLVHSSPFLSRMERYLGTVSVLIIMCIWQVGRILRWGLRVVPVIIYHCNAVPVVDSLHLGKTNVAC